MQVDIISISIQTRKKFPATTLYDGLRLIIFSFDPVFIDDNYLKDGRESVISRRQGDERERSILSPKLFVPGTLD